MGIQKDILIDHDQREIIDRTNAGILYQFNEDYYDLFEEKHIPWHWHEFLEIVYVVSGDIEYSFTEKKQMVHKGEMLFVNSNMLHAILPECDLSGCTIYVCLFDYHFLSGNYNSDIENKYFLPLLGCGAIPFHVFRPENETTIHMIHEFLEALEEDRERKYGYEFRVQSHLSSLWLGFLKELQPVIDSSKPQSAMSVKRLKTMMKYIQEHYTEKISLEDIAQSASISRRECTRCFQMNLNETPVDYLNRYRTDRAVYLLLHSEQSILEISENCGFSSGSYFSKVFGDIMKCTPKEFQKNHRTGKI